jgi:predicted enzyme related to lactoylglutathione lyase
LSSANSVTHFEIYAEDPEQLAEFYRELFSWRVEKAQGVEYYRVDTGNLQPGAIRGGLLRRPIESPRSWVNYVHVDDIARTLEQLVTLGGKIIQPKSAVPKTGWYALVEDPQQNVFALFQHDTNAFPPPVPEV